MKSLTPPLPSVLPITASTSSAANTSSSSSLASPLASVTLLIATLWTSTGLVIGSPSST